MSNPIEFVEACNRNSDKYINIPWAAEGTGTWLFESSELHEWLDSENSALLWLHGKRWCGKSVLAKTMVDSKLRTIQTRRPMVLCHFFFDSPMILSRCKDPEDKDFPSDDTEALRCILWQLCISSDELRGKLIQKLAKSPSAFLQSVTKLWRAFVEFSLLAKADVICVLDGLNEHHQRLLRHILNYLYGHPRDSKPTIKFIVTSRRAPPIGTRHRLRNAFRCVFARVGRQALIKHKDLQEQDLRHDLCIVVEHKAKFLDETSGDNRIGKLIREMKQCPNFFLYHITSQLIEWDPTQYGKAIDIKNLLSAAPEHLEDCIRATFGDCEESRFLREIIQKSAEHELLRPQGLFMWLPVVYSSTGNQSQASYGLQNSLEQVLASYGTRVQETPISGCGITYPNTSVYSSTSGNYKMSNRVKGE